MLAPYALNLYSLVFSGHGSSNVKLRISESFMPYLHDGQSGNLRAIENCILSLCSIEHNMRLFLRTVRALLQIPSWVLTHVLDIIACIKYKYKTKGRHFSLSVATQAGERFLLTERGKSKKPNLVYGGCSSIYDLFDDPQYSDFFRIWWKYWTRFCKLKFCDMLQ